MLFSASMHDGGNRRQGFQLDLSITDPEVDHLIAADEHRQAETIELSAPKNYVSRATWQALSSAVSLAVVEGYPKQRVHSATENIDAIEELAKHRATALFGCSYANVQPHSGTQANHAVFAGLLTTGDTVISMALSSGGHISHAHKGSIYGQLYRLLTYNVHQQTGLIDYAALRRDCIENKPRLIVVGGSSYPRIIDFELVRNIADEVGAYVLADISHFAGLVATGHYPSPFPHAHVVTSTTNKNLRGPQGGLILAKDGDLGHALDRGLVPGVQGGALAAVITAKAVAFKEAADARFALYSEQVLINARKVAEVLQHRGYKILTGGTDTPMVVLDLSPHSMCGVTVSGYLEAAGLPCNKTLMPQDNPDTPGSSGLRIGTSAVTTRGVNPAGIEKIAGLFADVLDAAASEPMERIQAMIHATRQSVRELANQYPLYRH